MSLAIGRGWVTTAPESPHEFLARVYDAEVRRLTALARVLTGDVTAAEDLAHDVFAIATRRLANDPGYLREPAWPWLRTTLVRLATQRRRKVLSEFRRMVRLYERPDPGRWPEEWLDYEAALQKLPQKMRAAVALFYGEDLSVAQVAAILDSTPKTVENTLATARKRLAPLLRGGD
jgi:RNA polymerase sigma factor (sigma-70 family)